MPKLIICILLVVPAVWSSCGTSWKVRQVCTGNRAWRLYPDSKEACLVECEEEDLIRGGCCSWLEIGYRCTFHYDEGYSASTSMSAIKYGARMCSGPPTPAPTSAPTPPTPPTSAPTPVPSPMPSPIPSPQPTDSLQGYVQHMDYSGVASYRNDIKCGGFFSRSSIKAYCDSRADCMGFSFDQNQWWCTKKTSSKGTYNAGSIWYARITQTPTRQPTDSPSIPTRQPTDPTPMPTLQPTTLEPTKATPQPTLDTPSASSQPSTSSSSSDQPSPPTEACIDVDEDDKCNKWSLLGQCDTNQAFMKTNCCQTCATVTTREEEAEEDISGSSGVFDGSSGVFVGLGEMAAVTALFAVLI